ncbi:RING finger protein unk isoform X2 [Oratosquilla oratoria]|uniref:RING finger protein unk isoform X2 n=1 Tax=Oratosquilla oratoria TaxID=337810 RepID=UPI003F75AB88
MSVCAEPVRSLTKTNKMKSQESKLMLSPQTEKPPHYSYLKEFRVEQCPLFLQHKCTQHRPFTCFYWHFMNQRRRRPIRRRDGTFNYSPDAYCTKFDENTGICPDGDDCPYLHRTAGDTERRYHLRYYKTGMCVHDTDTRGMCVKNGPHCAFAHGIDDVRPAVYDLREIQALELSEHEGTNGNGPNNLDKERNMVNDDPKWQDTNYVLANYKTEQCKRPPRLCRQGYACPQYHNSRDRRRSPKKIKYRSTACPNVKHGDEWGEPSNCENGDACQYCHTRTEQQFHPEIYKSTKCNDMQQNNYCPRGAFCAFAHVDQEMALVRETAANENCTGTSLADILQSALPPDNPPSSSSSSSSTSANNGSCTNNGTNSTQGLRESSKNGQFGIRPSYLLDGLLLQATSSNSSTSNHINRAPGAHLSQNKSNSLVPTPTSSVTDSIFTKAPPPNHPIAPIGSKPRHLSGNNSLSNNSVLSSSSSVLSGNSESLPSLGLAMPGHSMYMKAPGSEREDRETNIKKTLSAIDNDPKLDPLEKAKRKQSFLIANNLISTSSTMVTLPSTLSSTFVSSLQTSMTSSLSSTVSPLAPPFYPTSDTVESVVGSALEDLNLDEPLNIAASIDRDLDGENNALSNSISTGLANSGLLGSSAPVNIPGSNFHERSVLASLSPSTSSPAFPHSFLHSSMQNSLDQVSGKPGATAAFLGAGASKLSGAFPSSGLFDVANMSPHTRSSNQMSNPLSQSPLVSSFNGSEMQRLREELVTNRAKLASWEEGIAQARTACEAWKREAEEASRKAKLAEQAKDEALAKLGTLQKELEDGRGGQIAPYIHALHPHVELDKLPLLTLKALQTQLRQDLENVEKVSSFRMFLHCSSLHIQMWKNDSS